MTIKIRKLRKHHSNIAWPLRASLPQHYHLLWIASYVSHACFLGMYQFINRVPVNGTIRCWPRLVILIFAHPHYTLYDMIKSKNLAHAKWLYCAGALIGKSLSCLSISTALLGIVVASFSSSRGMSLTVQCFGLKTIKANQLCLTASNVGYFQSYLACCWEFKSTDCSLRTLLMFLIFAAFFCCCCFGALFCFSQLFS